jgi:hypothetical protein
MHSCNTLECSVASSLVETWVRIFIFKWSQQINSHSQIFKIQESNSRLFEPRNRDYSSKTTKIPGTIRVAFLLVKAQKLIVASLVLCCHLCYSPPRATRTTATNLVRESGAILEILVPIDCDWPLLQVVGESS